MADRSRLVYGQTRVGGRNLLWYGDFAASRVGLGPVRGQGRQSAAAAKGGSGGQTSYSASIVLGIGEGRESAFVKTASWAGQAQSGDIGRPNGFAQFEGLYAQAPWGYLRRAPHPAAGARLQRQSPTVAVRRTSASAPRLPRLPNYNFRGSRGPAVGDRLAGQPGRLPIPARSAGRPAHQPTTTGAGFPAARLGTLDGQRTSIQTLASPWTVPDRAACRPGLFVGKPQRRRCRRQASSRRSWRAPSPGQYAWSGGRPSIPSTASRRRPERDHPPTRRLAGPRRLPRSYGGAPPGPVGFSPALYRAGARRRRCSTDIATFTNAEWLWSSGGLHARAARHRGAPTRQTAPAGPRRRRRLLRPRGR